MRAPSRIPMIAVAAVVLSMSCCDAAVLVERNVDSSAGHPDSKPKDTVQLIECLSHKFCEPWQNTTCAKDADGKNRCLCGDQTHPINDNCVVQSAQELGMPCEQDDQCAEFTECVENEINKFDVKTCQCKDEFDNDGTCKGSSNGAVRTAISSMSLAIMTGIVLQINRY